MGLFLDSDGSTKKTKTVGLAILLVVPLLGLPLLIVTVRGIRNLFGQFWPERHAKKCVETEA
jgi:Na+-transporting methylmalonyl-CoA/oxaloacetate decarboxylase gamma subunit